MVEIPTPDEEKENVDLGWLTADGPKAKSGKACSHAPANRVGRVLRNRGRRPRGRGRRTVADCSTHPRAGPKAAKGSA